MSEAMEDPSRRFHDTSSAYILPNDAVEHIRLDAQAAAIVELIGGNPFHAPLAALKEPSKAVDVGCGTGVATIQIGNALPSAKVYGVDLSPIPEAAQNLAPRNVEWVQGNVLEVDASQSDKMSTDVFVPGTLDYWFGRILFLGITDWPKYYKTAFDTLKPGGLIETQDNNWLYYRAGTDEVICKDWEWYKATYSAFEKAGFSPTAGLQAEDMMKEAGFEIISRESYEWCYFPSPAAPKNGQNLAKYLQEKLMPILPGFFKKLLEPIGYSEQESFRLAEECKRDLYSVAGTHQKFVVTVARKPLE